MNRATVTLGDRHAEIISLPRTRRHLVELHAGGVWIGTWTAPSFRDAATIALRVTNQGQS
jgi:hypothetical protein